MSTKTPPETDPLLARLVDDAAIFPPGSLPLTEALDAHARHRHSWYAGLLGAFVVSDQRLPEALDLDAPLAVVTSGGAGAIAGVTGLCTRRRADLRRLEVAVRDLDDAVGNTRRIVAALDAARADGSLAEQTEVYVELPAALAEPSWLAAADEVALAGLRLKFRTGGADAAAVPGNDRLAAWIDAALDRETPFKATAGLHHAVAHTDPATGFDHHGFLNVLVATRAALDDGRGAAVAALAERDPETVATRAAALPAGTRTWFTSFGSCSVADPRDDLVSLGLLTAPVGVAR